MQILPHQQEALNFFINRHNAQINFAGNFSDTGVGKTLSALAFALYMYKKRPSKSILWVTLANLKTQLYNEISLYSENQEFNFPNVTIISGTKIQRERQYQNSLTSPTFLVINYEQLLGDCEWLAKFDFSLVVLDESTRVGAIKNKTRKNLMGLLQRSQAFRLAMTGTPVSNSPIELFGIMDFLKPNLLGNYWSFLMRYVVRSPYFNGVIGYKNIPELKARTEPHYIRHTRDSVLDLPGLQQQTITFSLTPKERKLYDMLKAGFLKELADQLKIDKPWNLSQAMLRAGKLLEICDDGSLVSTEFEPGTGSKLSTLKDILSTIPENDHIIIFSRFSRMCRILGTVLNVPVIDGDTPQETRDQLIQEFQAGKHRILVGSAAMSYGLNIQRANILVHYEVAASVAQAVQRTARAHRYGQEKVVLEYTLVAENTYEQKLQKKLASKQALSDALVQETSLVSSLGELADLL